MLGKLVMVGSATDAGFGNEASQLAPLISKIGDDDFGKELMDFFAKTCGAEHCGVYRFKRDLRPTVIATASVDGTDIARRMTQIYLDRHLWQKDPALLEADRLSLYEEAEPRFMRMNIEELPDSDLRDMVYMPYRPRIGEKIFLCGGMSDSAVGVSILCPKGQDVSARNEALSWATMASSVFAILSRHIIISSRRRDVSVALTDFDEIEACISHSETGLPKREVQVCARIVYGLSTLGISLDLGIGEETVMTYRKRIYSRLNISCQRELLIWYLSLWSNYSGSSPFGDSMTSRLTH